MKKKIQSLVACVSVGANGDGDVPVVCDVFYDDCDDDDGCHYFWIDWIEIYFVNGFVILTVKEEEEIEIWICGHFWNEISIFE